MTVKTIFSVGIIGCGWLGTALAKVLQAQDVKVTATRSSAENVAQLSDKGINAVELMLPAEQSELNAHAIFNAQCIVIAITPQFKKGREDYAEKVAALVKAAKANAQVEKVILLSSTAVYNGLSGNVVESSALDLTADKVSVLNQAEQAVLSFTDKGKKIGSVLRLSGLVGPNRHPGKFLLNGRMLKSPEAKVNLIHQDDAVGLIVALLNQQANEQLPQQNAHNGSGIFNGASDTHVSKKDYYQSAAEALGLAAPNFAYAEPEISPRIVCSDKAKRLLGYQFIQADLLAWLAKS